MSDEYLDRIRVHRSYVTIEYIYFNVNLSTYYLSNDGDLPEEVEVGVELNKEACKYTFTNGGLTLFNSGLIEVPRSGADSKYVLRNILNKEGDIRISKSLRKYIKKSGGLKELLEEWFQGPEGFTNSCPMNEDPGLVCNCDCDSPKCCLGDNYDDTCAVCSDCNHNSCRCNCWHGD